VLQWVSLHLIKVENASLRGPFIVYVLSCAPYDLLNNTFHSRDSLN